MDIKKRSAVLVKTSLFLFLSCTLSWAQGRASRIDGSRMERDLIIMEDVLENLLADDLSRHSFFRESKTKGMYLPGFGVLFQISNGGLPFTVIVRENIRARRRGEADISVMPRSNKSEDLVKVERRRIEAVHEFLQKYAANIGQLRRTDRIAVVCTLPPKSKSEEGLTKESMVAPLPEEGRRVIFSTTKSDIDDFRRKKLKEADFRKSVEFIELDERESRRNDFEILSNIFATALRFGEENAFTVDEDVDQLYITGFGALFLMTASYNGNLEVEFFTTSGMRTEEEKAEFIKQKSRSTNVVKVFKNRLDRYSEVDSARQKLIKQAYDDFEEQVLETMITYGRTLEQLKNDEWLTLAIKIENSAEHIPGRVVYQIKEKYLNAYDRRESSKKKTLDRVRISRYDL